MSVIRIVRKLLLCLLFQALMEGHETVAGAIESPSHRILPGGKKGAKAKKRTYRDNSQIVCESFTDSAQSVHMNIPLMKKLFSEGRLDIGDTFYMHGEESMIDFVDFYHATCTIIRIVPTYELSCHTTMYGPDGMITGSGDGASSVLEIGVEPQHSKYAITGGTGKFMGAFGEIEVWTDPIVASDPDDLDNSSFTHMLSSTMTLCYYSDFQN